MQKHFLWKRSTPKIKQSTLCNSFATGGLTNGKTWVKRLYEDNFHE